MVTQNQLEHNRGRGTGCSSFRVILEDGVSFLNFANNRFLYFRSNQGVMMDGIDIYPVSWNITQNSMRLTYKLVGDLNGCSITIDCPLPRINAGPYLSQDVANLKIQARMDQFNRWAEKLNNPDRWEWSNTRVPVSQVTLEERIVQLKADKVRYRSMAAELKENVGVCTRFDYRELLNKFLLCKYRKNTINKESLSCQVHWSCVTTKH